MEMEERILEQIKIEETPFEEDELAEKVTEHVEEFQSYFSNPEDDSLKIIQRSIFSKIDGLEREEHLSQPTENNGSTTISKIASGVHPEDTWVTVTGKVVETWEPETDAISQKGHLANEDDWVEFASWAKSDVQELTEGVVYELDGAVVDSYQGDYQINLNRQTDIAEEDVEFDAAEVEESDAEFEGAVVSVQDGSGLIKRCPVDGCGRVLQNGECSVHGDVEGEFDIRLMASLDNGNVVRDILITDEELVEEMTGISLESGKEMARDALDRSVVSREMAREIRGQFYHVEGVVFDRYLAVNSMQKLPEDERTQNTENLLIKARSMHNE